MDGLSYRLLFFFAVVLLTWSNLTKPNKIFKIIIKLHSNIKVSLEIAIIWHFKVLINFSTETSLLQEYSNQNEGSYVSYNPDHVLEEC